MTGRQLIDAIQKYHLEDFNINFLNGNGVGSKIIIEFDNGNIELPYPEYKNAQFDVPAYIYKYKFLKIDEEGNSECYDKEYDTSK